MSLKARLAAFRAEVESGAPPYNMPREVTETMHRATAELTASGAADRALKAGDRMPAFELADQDGNLVRSDDLLRRGPLAITFYRGVWCPYCNMELAALQEFSGQVAAAGGTLIAISPQTPANSRKSRRDNNLGFPVLADKDGAVAASFGLRFALPDYLAELYRNTLKIDLPRFNDDPSWTLPMPARYVVGPDGVIRYADVSPDYTTRPEPEDMLPALRQAAARAAE
jgi:peroxiredoxin